MPQSTVHISNNDQREFYFNALGKKISDFKKFIATTMQQPAKKDDDLEEIKRLLREAISFKDMFDIKSAAFTLTRDDVNLLVRILNTSA